MSYIVESEDGWGRKVKKVDMPRFTKDLIEALGKIAKDVRPAPVEDDRHDYRILVGNDRLNLHSNTYQLRDRVKFSITAPDVPWGDYNAYDKAQHAEEATVNPDGRSIDAIAKDIKKRVIDANAPALAARRAYSAQQAANRNDIVRLADALKERCPALEIRTSVQDQKAGIYGSKHYISASLHCDGTVSVDRIGSMDMGRFAKIVDLLNDVTSEGNE